jgi:thymidine kinase
VRIGEDGKVVAAGEQVHIGGNERYESKCRRHYKELMVSALDGTFNP